LRRSRAVVLENLALRQQLAVLRRTVTPPPLRDRDRLFWILRLAQRATIHNLRRLLREIGGAARI
jgi:hypothetical protein